MWIHRELGMDLILQRKRGRLNMERVGYLSREEIDRIRKDIWNVDPKEYKAKVESYKEFQAIYLKRVEQELKNSSFFYRLESNIKNIFKK